MSFVKLPKVIQDYGLGKETINKANDNNAQLRDAYAEKHGTKDPNAGNPWHQVGQHDDDLVARTVLRVRQVTYVIDPVPFVFAAGPGMPPVGGFLIGGGGHFTINVALDSLRAMVIAEQDDSTPTRIVRWNYTTPSATAPVRGLEIWLYELSGGAFALADYDFQLQLWGTPFS